MDPSLWLAQFRTQHGSYLQGKLSPEETAAYFRARDQLARSLLAAQGLTVGANETPRQAFRVRHAFQVELVLPLGSERVVTLDVSRGGFSCLMAKPPDPRDDIGITMRLSAATEPVVGRVRFSSATKATGNFRCSFIFKELSEADLERLETTLFEVALARIP